MELIKQTKTDDLFKPGDLSKNRFKIIKKLAQGGFAVAYLAQDQSQENSKIVLKVAEVKPIIVTMMEEQYQLIRSFDHPNIIKAYEFYRQQIKKNQYLFIIMEYAEEGDLKGKLGKLKEEDIFKIYHQVKSAIQYIHARGIIHRDLTLSNILLDAKKNVKVIDFGIAAQLKEKTHIATQFQKGTRLYKPIQLIQELIVTKQNDLWQFGITLIQLVTKKEISQIANNKIPCFIENFPEEVFIQYNVNNQFRSIISPLLRNKYKERKFCEDTIITEITEKMSKVQVGSNKKGIKIKSRQPIQSIQSVEYETTSISQKVEIKQEVKKTEIKQEFRIPQVPQLEIKQKVEIKQEIKKPEIKQEFIVPQAPQLSLKIKQKYLKNMNDRLKNLKEKPTDLEIKCN